MAEQKQNLVGRNGVSRDMNSISTETGRSEPVGCCTVREPCCMDYACAYCESRITCFFFKIRLYVTRTETRLGLFSLLVFRFGVVVPTRLDSNQLTTACSG